MKKFLLSLSVLAISTIAMAQQKSTDVAVFDNEVIAMGNIEQGTPKTVTFTVKNVGKAPLIIETAQPTCSCTIGDYTKSPIAPGQTGVITATYNAAAAGSFEKHMNVKFAGYDDNRSITIKGVVVSKEEMIKEVAVVPAADTKVKTKQDANSSKVVIKTDAGKTKKKVKTNG